MVRLIIVIVKCKKTEFHLRWDGGVRQRMSAAHVCGSSTPAADDQLVYIFSRGWAMPSPRMKNSERGAMIRNLAVAAIFANFAIASLSVASAQGTTSQSSAPGFVNTLMPQPSQLSTQEGRLVFTLSFRTVTDHFRDPRLDAAMARSLGRIESRTGISIPTSPEIDTPTGALIVSVD